MHNFEQKKKKTSSVPTAFLISHYTKYEQLSLRYVIATIYISAGQLKPESLYIRQQQQQLYPKNNNANVAACWGRSPTHNVAFRLT